MAEINAVPLVDVMLLLLVIFIATAPLLTHSVKIDLPKGSVENLQRIFSCRNIIRSNGLRHGAKAMLNFSVCEHANRRPNLHEARRCGEKTSPKPPLLGGLGAFRHAPGMA